MSVHNQEDMSDAVKLVYLRQAVKGGPVAQVIEGLSHSGEQYTEAIACFKSHYNQPECFMKPM